MAPISLSNFEVVKRVIADPEFAKGVLPEDHNAVLDQALAFVSTDDDHMAAVMTAAILVYGICPTLLMRAMLGAREVAAIVAPLLGRICQEEVLLQGDAGKGVA
jgi:hypothetical protein